MGNKKGYILRHGKWIVSNTVYDRFPGNLINSLKTCWRVYLRRFETLAVLDFDILKLVIDFEIRLRLLFNSFYSRYAHTKEKSNNTVSDISNCKIIICDLSQKDLN